LRPKVIGELEITITQRSEAEQCLILARDGMWDVHYYKMPLQQSGGSDFSNRHLVTRFYNSSSMMRTACC
jgi:hypothetical protein